MTSYISELHRPHVSTLDRQYCSLFHYGSDFEGLLSAFELVIYFTLYILRLPQH